MSTKKVPSENQEQNQNKTCEETPLTVTADDDNSEVSVKKISLKKVDPESDKKDDKTSKVTDVVVKVSAEPKKSSIDEKTSTKTKTADPPVDLPDSVTRLDKMIKKPDWINKNPAFNGKINKVNFLENMLKEFKEAEEVIN